MLCPSCGADAGDISRYCPSCGSTIVRPDEEDNYIGKIVAKKYRVDQLIGEGGMGKVYRAKQLALDKPVVLKVLRQSLLSDERTVARFQREAKAASRLNHPNSISILDFGQTDEGALYIAMEFVSGRDLHQVLSKEWPLPEARVVRIVGQVLSALSDAHGANVIHRDLKPENIMLEQRRGEPDFVKVLDFGIAKIQDASGEEGPALTRAGFVCGTPEYMSPEQARGAALDHRSDLYAVGVILYQLMTGMLPFDSDSAVGFATKHLTEEPPPPSRRRPDARISPGMERLILKALSKDPNDRPQSAEAFRAELLAVDKERRASGQRPRNAMPASQVLQPLPRKMTPGDQDPTNIQTVQTQKHWDANEATVQATVRAYPEAMSRSSEAPSRQPEAVLPRSAPVLPRPERAVKPSRTDPDSPPPSMRDDGNRLLKVMTVALVLIAVGLAGFYFYQTRMAPRPEPEEVVIHPNAPVPAGAKKPLYERDIPIDRRDAEGAHQLALKADDAYRRGQLEQAIAHYRQAFEKDPSPELSLKLGQALFESGHTDEAKAWWQRHLRDQPQSKARAHIQEMVGEPTP